VDSALARKNITTKAVERWKDEMPTEQEMLPKDKYTIFDRKEKKYRKGIHSMFRRMIWRAWTKLMRVQSFQSGRDYPNDSTRLVTDWFGKLGGYLYHTVGGVEVFIDGVMVRAYISKELQDRQCRSGSNEVQFLKMHSLLKIVRRHPVLFPYAS
jgi:hypothetical protein